jgi:ATP-dependent Clp protease ATP-binding subunit ClpC
VVQRSEKARRVLELARAEAEGFGHRYLGPEHLVLGVLRDGDSGASRVPRTPLRDPPMLIGQVLYHAGVQAEALGLEVIGPELLLWGWSPISGRPGPGA